MQILGIIPARYASSRFPGKPLADIHGKSMIERVVRQAQQCEALSRVVVATDDKRIFDHVLAFGGLAVMTGAQHRTGTDRCGEVLHALEEQGEQYDVVVNIQGDEPYIDPLQIMLAVSLFDNPDTQIATLALPISAEDNLWNPNVVKVAFGSSSRALCFSRLPVPFLRDVPREEWLKEKAHFKHIGMYAYRAEVLKKLVLLPQGILEKSESLEQLRWLENGFSIAVAVTHHESMAVDTPEDLAKLIKLTCDK